MLEGLNPAQRQLAQQGIRSAQIIGRTTKSTSRLAEQLGKTEKEIRAAIEQCKQKGLPRGTGRRNPDVRVDPVSGDVYPDLGNGMLGDSIGDIFEFL
jgi:hypothetical protein